MLPTVWGEMEVLGWNVHLFPTYRAWHVVGAIGLTWIWQLRKVTLSASVVTLKGGGQLNLPPTFCCSHFHPCFSYQRICHSSQQVHCIPMHRPPHVGMALMYIVSWTSLPEDVVHGKPVITILCSCLLLLAVSKEMHFTLSRLIRNCPVIYPDKQFFGKSVSKEMKRGWRKMLSVLVMVVTLKIHGSIQDSYGFF